VSSNALRPAIRLTDLFNIGDWHDSLSWQPLSEGVDVYPLYEAGSGSKAVLLRYQPGSGVAAHRHIGYEHILVLHGKQTDELGTAESGTLTINPPGTAHTISSDAGCIVLAIYEKPVRFLDALGVRTDHGFGA
jgi:anti-sigma factor ChrR (cupin superfamily)